ncbi:MAG: adenosylcobyric acid synthase [Desulforhopalus sp.]|jgi:adenosylcobyric acid synthase
MKTFEHGGNIHKASREANETGERILDFSANINPLGPPEWLRPLLSRELEQVFHYPDPENLKLVGAIAGHLGVSSDCVIPGNGTTELLYAIMRALPCERVVIPVPSYVDYVRAAEIAGKEVVFFPLKEEHEFALQVDDLKQELRPGDLVVIALPNNPTGKIPDRTQLAALVRLHPDTFFLFDEAFLDFIGDYPSFSCSADNVITLNSMTKFYAIPGLRLGFATLPVGLASLLKSQLPPWSVNTLAQVTGKHAVEDEEYQKRSIVECAELLKELTAQLTLIPELKVFSSTVNYLLIKLLKENTINLRAHCRKAGILIRTCDNYNGINEPDKFFRIAVRSRGENEKLIEVLRSFFTSHKKIVIAKKTPSLMFQGTCSDAGKSILTAALCRIMFQDGYNIAPFKAQNMSLNSFVTLQGDEMGRAQVVQAQAAKIDPDYRMNPILLKPNSDTGSQVIINGRPVGNMNVMEYNRYKSLAWPEVCKAYDSLASEYDAIILEGAGSPGEVNLKKDDVVNMRMAQYADAPVVLVGDIDRGGVYASFVGIMEVLAEWERNLVAGFMVNKFRGQASLLESAHDYLKLHTDRPVFGVIPHIKNLGIPEEDSVSFKKGSFNTGFKKDSVEIAVINLPHISNFTDIEPFLEEPDVTLRIIDNVGELISPDVIIIPGSKNVINDLEFLRQTGLLDLIIKQYEKGVEVVGICGGYQMLGQSIKDPDHMESSLYGETGVTGMGLLEMDTILAKEKNLTRKSGTHLRSGQEVFGYEIHHGVSTGSGNHVLQFSDQTTCGTSGKGAKIWGAYLHGIFDSDLFRRWFIDNLRVEKGLQPLGKVVAPYDLESSFDHLADVVRDAIDVSVLYKLMKL